MGGRAQRSRGWVARGFALAILWSGAASGDAWLDWKAPPECPGGERIVARIEEWHGQPLDGARKLEVDASVDWSDDRWRVEVRLSLDGHVAERSIHVENCADAADFVAMTVVLAVDPDAHVPGSEEPHETAPEPVRDEQQTEATAAPVEATAIEDAADSGEAKAPRDRRTLRPVMSGGFVVSTGALPNVAFGVHAEAGVSWGALETALGALWLPGAEVSHVEALVPVSYGLFAGTLRASYRFGSKELSIAPTLQLAIGAERADPVEVEGVTPRSSVSELWGAVGFGVRAAWQPLPWFAPYLAVLGDVPFAAPEFVLTDGTVVHQPGPGALAEAGILFFFARD